jgi:hypothetical protein
VSRQRGDGVAGLVRYVGEVLGKRGEQVDVARHRDLRNRVDRDQAADDRPLEDPREQMHRLALRGDGEALLLELVAAVGVDV